MGVEPSAESTLAAVDPTADTQMPLPSSGPGPDSLDVDLAHARAREALLGLTSQPQQLGRYILLDKLGRGGMGVVYAAYDPKLDRKIAIKLVNNAWLDARGTDAQRLLEREARAAATLSHPNVVTIHDVGHAKDQLFVAMELVEGETLTAWARTSRTWPEVVELFVQLGRGLAAAHDAGLVHRDFKPDNVLIGSEGRPRIADFGLALALPRHDAATTSPGDAPSTASSHERHQTPGIVGTPRYMSPEQWRGTDVGPASDQYSFCLVLYEVLLGERPDLEDSQELAIPRSARIPAPLARLLEKGLRMKAQQRHPHMHAVVEQLRRLQGRGRRRVTFGVASAVAIATLGLGYQLATAQQPQPCEDVVTARTHAWSPSTRDAVVTALDASSPAHGDEAVEVLDDYADRWTQARHAACEATHVRGDQSQMALQLRVACLDRHLGRLEGLATELSAGGPMPWLDGSEVHTLLPPLSECEDIQGLARLFNRFDTHSVRDSTEQDRAASEVQALLARADVARRMGKPDTRRLAQRARELSEQHDLTRGLAHALRILAYLELTAGNHEQARALYAQALQHAIAGGSDPEVVDLLLIHADKATRTGQLDVARTHLDYVDALAQRVPDEAKRAFFAARAQQVRARIDLEHGRYAEALEKLAPALALAEQGQYPETSLLPLHNTVADIYARTGRSAEALDLYQRVLERTEQELGPDHVEVGTLLNNIAFLHPEPHVGVELAERAYGIVVDRSEPGDPLVPNVLDTWATLEVRVGRYAEAQEHREQIIEQLGALYGPDHPAVASSYEQLAQIALARCQGSDCAPVRQRFEAWLEPAAPSPAAAP